MSQSPERDQSEVISVVEHRMESLLTDFFRAEVPPGFRNSLNLNASDRTGSAPVLLRIPETQIDLKRSSENRSVTGRFAVLTSLALLMICAILLPAEDGPLRDSTKSATSELLPVSSEAGIPPASGQIIGPNGLTIEETDGVDFRPKAPSSRSEHSSPRSK